MTNEKSKGDSSNHRDVCGHLGFRAIIYDPAPKFIEGSSWADTEKRFNEYAVDGKLFKDKFCLIIEMSDSEEFAGELYDTMARRMNVDTSKGITLDEMRMFWKNLSTKNLNTRLQIFSDMCDKNGDGKLSKDEFCQAIVLSASTNQFDKVKSQAESYAALIMEELDFDHRGYIELWQLEAFLVKMWTSPGHGILEHHEWSERLPPPRCPTIIKGLWGAPEKRYKKYDTLLLIGIDGGATFFNSILKDLLNDLQESSTQDVKIRKRPQKAYSYWITSEQGSFTNLFKDVVDDIAQYCEKFEALFHFSCKNREFGICLTAQPQ
uniref:EF-hand domain-containing protein n=1 Tax=Chenopodium quinoa TaxID=63459 RepID=A0A803LCR7_CHEQI